MRPAVTLHFAQSIDGRIATRSGDSRGISATNATRFAHELRAKAGAVIIGSGTALADDPLLTVRHVDGPNPIRVVLDARGRLPPTSQLVRNDSARTIQASCEPRTLPSHVTNWVLPKGPAGEGVDLEAVLAKLGDEGIERVLVEGGRRVITAFLRADLADRIIVCIAPIVIGAGIDTVGDLDLERVAHARRFATREVWRLGDDTMIELTRP